MPGAKNWVFTLNNYSEDDIFYLLCLPNDDANDLTYIVFGEEHAPSTGTPHLQGYLQFATRRTLNHLRCLLPQCHCEVARGSPGQAIEYCRKEGRVHEAGTPPVVSQGSRNDLAALHESLVANRSLVQISNDHFASFIRYQRSIYAWKNLNAPNEREAPQVYVFWGDAGAGKTRRVWDNHPAEDIWVYGGGGWFDGYIGQEVALFDDFHGSELNLNLLLRVLDRYPLSVPIKGSFTRWCPRTIYITSNLDPNTWYPNVDSARLAALRRRFTTVSRFTNVGSERESPLFPPGFFTRGGEPQNP